MEMAQNVSIAEMTEAITARLLAQWEGWKNQGPAPNDAIIAEDFQSFWPDGARHVGRPTAQQMTEQPISGYKLSQLRAVRICCPPLPHRCKIKAYLVATSIPASTIRILCEIRHHCKKILRLTHKQSHVRQELNHAHGNALCFSRSNNRTDG
jgi:hypothetical protein